MPAIDRPATLGGALAQNAGGFCFETVDAASVVRAAVGDDKTRTIVVAELIFRKIALQVLGDSSANDERQSPSMSFC
jgi:hypothetical protein